MAKTAATAHPAAPVLKEVGSRIRAARLAIPNFSQEDAASKAGIDPRRWQRIEAGSVNLTVRTLVRIAAAVGTDFWRLLGRESAPR